MPGKKHIAISLTLLAALAGPARAGPAKAAVGPKSGFDGQWVIDATTSSFFCPVKSKRIVALVQGGQVARMTGLPGKASGKVGDDGAVVFSLSVFGVTATVRGRLAGGFGAGDWSSNSIICARGDWRAALAGNQ